MLLRNRPLGPKVAARSNSSWLRSRRPVHHTCRVACSGISAPSFVDTTSVALVPLMGSVRAHESSLTVASILEDSRDGSKLLVTASLDKTIAAWRLEPNQEGDAGQPFYVEVQKIAAPGGPIFSIAPRRKLPGQSHLPQPRSSADGREPIPTIFCGNAAKEVVSWQPLMPAFTDLKLNGHSGWVRAVATYDKYLFSCGGNYLRQWDCTYATPKMIHSVKLYTGDILGIAASKGYVFTSGADGSLRSWGVDKTSGAMTECAVQERAHDGRISVLLLHKGRVYTSGVDGLIRVWREDTLELVAQVPAAHGGDKVQCMALAGNGVLYSGGDDHMIRAWVPETLQPLRGFEPLEAHSSSVRTMAAGEELLISGDSDGFVNFFSVPSARASRPWSASDRSCQAAGMVADIFAPKSPVPDMHPCMGTKTMAYPAASSQEQLTEDGNDSDNDPPGPSSREAAASVSAAAVGTSDFAASLSPKPEEPTLEYLAVDVLARRMMVLPWMWMLAGSFCSLGSAQRC